jgi:hypothetical protein
MKTRKGTMGYFYLVMVVVLVIAMACSCTKTDVKPEQQLFWENSTADTVYISVYDVDSKIFCLMPGQGRKYGTADWIGHHYVIAGEAGQFVVSERNTIE